jgi:hypothetical protein
LSDTEITPIMHSKLTVPQLTSLALWNAALGGSINCSDRLHLLPRDRVRLWQFLKPLAEPCTARLPRWGHTKGLLLVVLPHRSGTSWAVLGLNSGEHALDERVTTQELVGNPQAYCAAWKVGDIAPLEQCSGVVFKLQPHESRLFFVSAQDLQPAANTGLYGETVPLMKGD